MDQFDNSISSPIPVAEFICLSTLAQLPGVYIKQKFERLEAATGCETPNVYKVYPGDHEGNKAAKKPIFKCKEKSECCQRICCPGDCRAFKMKVKQYYKGKGNDDDDLVVMKFEREFKCTCLCFGRPYLDVFLKGREDRQIGRIFSPFLCCDRGVHIQGANDELKYKMMANCCQLGFFCQCPCEACQKIQFVISNSSDEPLCDMWKVSAGCCKACVSDADCFKVPFPQNASPEDKALILAATIFIDYRYFEENDNKRTEVKAG